MVALRPGPRPDSGGQGKKGLVGLEGWRLGRALAGSTHSQPRRVEFDRDAGPVRRNPAVKPAIRAAFTCDGRCRLAPLAVSPGQRAAAVVGSVNHGDQVRIHAPALSTRCRTSSETAFAWSIDRAPATIKAPDVKMSATPPVSDR